MRFKVETKKYHNITGKIVFVPLTKIKHLVMNGCDSVMQFLQFKFHRLAQHME